MPLFPARFSVPSSFLRYRYIAKSQAPVAAGKHRVQVGGFNLKAEVELGPQKVAVWKGNRRLCLREI